MLIPEGKAVLTKEFLLNTPRELRQQEIFYHIWDHKIDKNFLEQFEEASKLTEGHQMIFILWHLQGEVNNGGYYQYFDNFENCNQIKQPYYNLTIDWLKKIGCVDLSNDYSRFLQIYRKCEELKRDGKCIDMCDKCNRCSRFDEEIEKLDNGFYENESIFIQAIDDYIDANLDDFVSSSDAPL